VRWQHFSAPQFHTWDINHQTVFSVTLARLNHPWLATVTGCFLFM